MCAYLLLVKGPCVNFSAPCEWTRDENGAHFIIPALLAASQTGSIRGSPGPCIIPQRGDIVSNSSSRWNLVFFFFALEAISTDISPRSGGKMKVKAEIDLVEQHRLYATDDDEQEQRWMNRSFPSTTYFMKLYNDHHLPLDYLVDTKYRNHVSDE